MKIEISIPDYFTVKHYKEFDKFAHLEERDQMLAMISLLTNTPKEELMEWPIKALVEVYNALNNELKTITPEFYPVIEWEGQLYGYQPMHKMSTAEYIDIDTLAKDAKNNLNQLLAVFYRPITRNKLKSTKFITKSIVRAYNGEAENAFDYYDVEKYDSKERKANAERFDSFPVNIALGALTFFLDSKAPLLKSSETYFPKWDEMMTTIKTSSKRKSKHRLANTMVGWLLYTSLQKLPSYKSQETNQSSTQI